MNLIGRLRIAIATVLVMAGPAALAQQIPLQNLDETEFKDLVGELSTNFLHTSVSGAGTLGDLFGFEVGLVGGTTKTPNINSVAQSVDQDANVERVYHAALLGALTVPFGITVEAGLVPKVGSDEFKFNMLSLAVKWTPTALFWELPVDLAVKLHMSKAHMEFHTTSGGGDTDYDYDNRDVGLLALVSKNFGIVEPYFGIGPVRSKGELGATGTYSSNLFTYTGDTSASADVSGTMWVVGTEFKIILAKLGLEYTRLHDTGRFSGKLSFYF